MGTITGISDLDPVRWPNSHWRSVKVLQLYLHDSSMKTLAKFTMSLFLLTLSNSTCLDCGLKYEWLSLVYC